jgi:membrane peptidoglycan carboxypeptidase
MPGGKRSTVNEALILHLASGLTVEKAAALVGLSRATAFRRLADPTFKQRVREARESMLARAFGSLSASAVKASAALRKLLKSDSEKIRLAAAQQILTLALKTREAITVDERLAELEKRLSEIQESKGRRR